MAVDSRTMELRLPGQKLKNLRLEAAKIRDQSPTLSAREVSRAVPLSPCFTEQYREEQLELQCSMSAVPSIQRGAELVDTPANTLEWEESGNDTTGSSYRIGCFPHRVGSVLPGDTHGRPVVHNGKATPHQLPGITSAVKTFLKGQENKHVLLLLDNTTAVAYMYVNNLSTESTFQIFLL